MTPALQHRVQELDRQIERAQPEYARTKTRLADSDYGRAMAKALGRIYDVMNTPTGDRVTASESALMKLGRIWEIVAPFHDDQVLIDHYETLKEQRRKWEDGNA